MTEKNTLDVRNFNHWLWTVACEAGCIVEHDETRTRGFIFTENNYHIFAAPTMRELIEELDKSGYWPGLFGELSETFDF